MDDSKILEKINVQAILELLLIGRMAVVDSQRKRGDIKFDHPIPSTMALISVYEMFLELISDDGRVPERLTVSLNTGEVW